MTKFRLRGVPSSVDTEKKARFFGVPLVALDEVEWLDVTIDGADEIDSEFNMIKGAGGAPAARTRRSRPRPLLGLRVAPGPGWRGSRARTVTRGRGSEPADRPPCTRSCSVFLSGKRTGVRPALSMDETGRRRAQAAGRLPRVRREGTLCAAPPRHLAIALVDRSRRDRAKE
ncbi:MAG: ribose-5-phosphate isomerase A [Planctomycetota bacterium]